MEKEARGARRPLPFIADLGRALNLSPTIADARCARRAQHRRCNAGRSAHPSPRRCTSVPPDPSPAPPLDSHFAAAHLCLLPCCVPFLPPSSPPASPPKLTRSPP